MIQYIEILVPTIYGDTLKPISTKHHKAFDSKILALTNGMTILSPGKGKWIYKGDSYIEKVIPVRIMCDSTLIDKIVKITLNHYRQKAVMHYVLTEKVFITYA